MKIRILIYKFMRYYDTKYKVHNFNIVEFEDYIGISFELTFFIYKKIYLRIITI